MKEKEPFKKPEKKEGRTVLLQKLCGRDKELYKALAFNSLLSAGRPSELIPLEEASKSAREWEEKASAHEQGGRSQEATQCCHQTAAWYLILARRALFNGDEEVLEECLQKYEALGGKRLLPEKMVGRAIEVARKYYQSQSS